jgi:hypothetical protein
MQNQPTRTLLRFVIAVIAIAALFAIGGCSFSASSESISNSISSPFTSSSESSKSEEAKYRDEVAEYSAAFVSVGGGSVASFQTGISKLAARRGISDWEANPDTWTSVGRGLAITALTEVEALAYGETWAAEDERRFELMRQGFSEAR